MRSTEAGSDGRPGLGGVKRRGVRLASEHLASIDPLFRDEEFPVAIRPSTDGINAAAWSGRNRQVIDELLLKHGAILLRGFKVDSIARFEELVSSFGLQLLDYFDQHTPRSKMSAKVYTSTEYPADHTVPFHSENSKNDVWPMRIWFCCLQPALRGGETPIADNRKVFQLLDPRIKDRFVEKQVMYVRNFGDGLGLSWQTAFQAKTRAEVEKRCRESGMQIEWKDADRLRVRHVCQAVTRHPRTGEMLWFNQAHLFHITNVEPLARQSLLDSFSEEDLPSNAYYGDGTPIEASVVDEIRQAFREASVIFPWSEGDVLMLDNMLISHGRAPFIGPRKVIVAMADAFSWNPAITA